MPTPSKSQANTRFIGGLTPQLTGSSLPVGETEYTMQKPIQKCCQSDTSDDSEGTSSTQSLCQGQPAQSGEVDRVTSGIQLESSNVGQSLDRVLSVLVQEPQDVKVQLGKFSADTTAQIDTLGRTIQIGSGSGCRICCPKQFGEGTCEGWRSFYDVDPLVEGSQIPTGN
ncbi:hypothetical protein BS17DRAFT_764009 [Gyrodon lividus]|nr:hypothetical protein BS17DRAFT_764009 [Gyrodon lividus]